MPAKGWRKMPDGAGGFFWMRPLGNDQVECVRKERIGGSRRAKKEMRDEMSKPGQLKHTEVNVEGGMRLVASIDQAAADVMDQQTGGDPEKVQRWLRDNPEHLVVPRNSAGLPGGRKVFYPGLKRS